MQPPTWTNSLFISSKNPFMQLIAPFFTSLILLLFTSSIFAQSEALLEEYVGPWAGQLEDVQAFNFTIQLQQTKEKKYRAIFRGKKQKTTLVLKKEADGYLAGNFEDQLLLRIDTSTEIPTAFLQVGHHLSHLFFKRMGRTRWEADWNLLLSEEAEATFYLSIESDESSNYSVLPYFKEPTFHYLYGQDFAFKDDKFFFRDIRSTIRFKGELNPSNIELELSFLNETSKITLQPHPYIDWALGMPKSPTQQQAVVKNGLFSNLVNDILSDSLEQTHSIVIAKNGAIIFEQYFDGFSRDIPHDTRSLAKSFAGTAVGMAIIGKQLKDETQKIKPFLEEAYPEIKWSKQKAAIQIDHLLKMCSGLDAIDFGLDRQSFANEGAYQNQEDWTQHILSAPMIESPGTKAYYGSGNPHLVGPILEKVLNDRLEFYLHKKLFGPLAIDNYRIQTNNYDQPYFGGGWYFTPKDLIKFGQLYLNKGQWNGKQIISEKWVLQSMAKHTILENTRTKNKYGYLFWHETYMVKGHEIESIEARGSGGQYLFLVPSLDLVVAITSGNYRNGKFAQPEIIMEKYILPALIP